MVRAMTSRVEIVRLGGKDKDGEKRDTISLDFDTLPVQRRRCSERCTAIMCALGGEMTMMMMTTIVPLNNEYEDPYDRDERRGENLD